MKAERRATGTRGWRVRILVDAGADAAAVRHHVERFGCRVIDLRPRGLLLELPNASGAPDAEAEARLYLAMWHASHPRATPTVAAQPAEAAWPAEAA